MFIKENEVDTCRLYDFNEYLKGKKEQSYLQPFDLSLQLSKNIADNFLKKEKNITQFEKF